MPPPPSQPLLQLLWLVLLAIPIATVAWTVTHEEVFREPREYCQRRARHAPGLLQRKFFYLFTCEYCFSHYVTLFFLILTGYRLLLDDWRGYIISFFALVAVANVYMSLYARVRVELRSERTDIQVKETQIQQLQTQSRQNDAERGSP